MTGIDVDDLYGKAISAVQKHWDQNYVISEEERSGFAHKFIYKVPHQEIDFTYSNYKLESLDFLPTKRDMN